MDTVTRSLYRAMLRSAKHYDATPWHRARLAADPILRHHVGGLEWMLRDDSCLAAVRTAFRERAKLGPKAASEARQRGFGALRAMTTTAGDRTPFQTRLISVLDADQRASASRLPPSRAVATATSSAATSASSGVASAKPAGRPRAATFPGRSSSSSSSSSMDASAAAAAAVRARFPFYEHDEEDEDMAVSSGSSSSSDSELTVDTNDESSAEQSSLRLKRLILSQLRDQQQDTHDRDAKAKLLRKHTADLAATAAGPIVCPVAPVVPGPSVSRRPKSPSSASASNRGPRSASNTFHPALAPVFASSSVISPLPVSSTAPRASLSSVSTLASSAPPPPTIILPASALAASYVAAPPSYETTSNDWGPSAAHVFSFHRPLRRVSYEALLNVSVHERNVPLALAVLDVMAASSYRLSSPMRVSLADLFAQQYNVPGALHILRDSVWGQHARTCNATVDGIMPKPARATATNVDPTSDEWLLVLNSTLLAVCKEPHGTLAFDLYAMCVRFGITPNLRTYEALLLSCFYANQPQQAARVLDTMKAAGLTPALSCYNAVLSTYSFDGHVRESLQLVKRMVSDGVQPTVVSFRWIFNAALRANDRAWMMQVLQTADAHGISRQQLAEAFTAPATGAGAASATKA